MQTRSGYFGGSLLFGQTLHGKVCLLRKRWRKVECLFNSVYLSVGFLFYWPGLLVFPPYNSVQRTPKTKLKLPRGFRLVLAPDLNYFLESARPVFRQFEGYSFRQPFLRAERGLWKLILWSNFTIVLREDPLGTHVRGVYKKRHPRAPE